MIILASVALLAACTPKAKDSITIPPQMEKKIASIHIVEKEESLYKIATQYGVTREAIIELNPSLSTQKLKKGMKLYIPFAQKKEQTEEVQDSVKTEQPKEEKKEKTTRAAIILPFMLNQYAPTEQERMIEFYEGILLAVERLKEEGHSYDIYTYDSRESTQSLDSLINSGALDKCDILIGALYPEHNKQLATYAKQHNIPLVIPFTVKDDEIYNNPKVFIANSLQKYIVEEGVNKFTEKYRDANVIFVKDAYNIEEKEFATELHKALEQKGISYTNILMDSLINMTNSSGSSYVASLMKPDTQNIFIPTSSKIETFNTILPTLLVLKRDTLSSIPEFSLFGYPEWQIYAGSNLEAMYEVDTYFYTSFYTNNLLPEAIDIQAKYAKWYNRSMQNRYPRYGMLGYDIGYYFLKAASLYGSKIGDNINNIEFTPTQSGFKFTRKNNRGSYINNKVFFIHYSPEYKVIKTDPDK